MAVTAVFTQMGDIGIGGLLSNLAIQNPNFWIVGVTITTTPEPDLYIVIKFTIGATTYEFRAINIDYVGTVGVTGYFMFDGTNILNAILNDPDDIIPTGDQATATEMFKLANIKVYYNIGAGDVLGDNVNINFVNAARDIGIKNIGAAMDDWYDMESKTFFSQAAKKTYWYFYNRSAAATQFLEYVEINKIPEAMTLIDDKYILTDNSEILTNTE